MKTRLMILVAATMVVAGCNSNPTRQEIGVVGNRIGKEMERK